MKNTINLSDLRDAFHRANRGSQFSYEGLEVLFDGLEELEQDTGEEMELDVIALCCDFAEMTPEEAIEAYGIEVEDDGNQLNNVMDYLNDQTWLLGATKQGTIVFRQF
jgi:hypothetical protein